MTQQQDNPKVTQYALGEMSKEEMATFELEIKANPELLKEIEDIKEMQALLEDGFSGLPKETLSEPRKKVIAEKSQESYTSSASQKHTFMRVILSAVAVLVAAFIIVQIQKRSKKEKLALAPSETVKRENGYEYLPKSELVLDEVEELEEDQFIIAFESPVKKANLEVFANKKVIAPKCENTLPTDFCHDGTLTKRMYTIKEVNRESYSRIVENVFKRAVDYPLSTFSIDVDTASYSNVRRMINQGNLPPADSVRIEELVNYFSYEYPQPRDDKPFSVNFEMATCPWAPAHKLVKVGLKGKDIAKGKRPLSNLVFLLDVSGSMSSENKLPLLKKSVQLLLNQLGENDRIAIVVYAGASGLALPSTTADKKETILSALSRLNAGGSTNGGAGIELAYKIAAVNFIEGGINRVILATDGDFNVGITSEGGLERLIEKSAKSGTFLSVLGFGMGNYKDANLEKLSGKGNGNYAYIDTLAEAKKVLVNEMNATLITIAKDVKIQVEFNPLLVEGYRLIGYENRILAKEDFNDDKKDAGEIGAGHTVTAFYEIVPKGSSLPAKVDPLKYQAPATKAAEKTPIHTEFKDELMTVKLRYKEPDGTKSKLITCPLKNTTKAFASASDDFKFASAVVAFGQLLRGSKYQGDMTYSAVLELAKGSVRGDKHGYKKEFISLLKKVEILNMMK